MSRLPRYVLFTVLFLPLLLYSQADSSFQYIKTVKGDIVGFAVDNLDNLYLFSSTNQLKKLDVNGDSIAVFNNVRKLGKASYIDVSNPLRILLYYKNFATIVILDRLLNIRATIDLRKQNIYQVQAICLSFDNNIWLFDELENKLKKIDETGRLLLETSDFRQLFGEASSPGRIYDQDGYVYLYNRQKNVYVFDYYGALKNDLALPGWNNFKVVGKSVFGTRNDTLHRYRMGLPEVASYKMPAALDKGGKVDFTSTRFYALRQNELDVYLLK